MKKREKRIKAVFNGTKGGFSIALRHPNPGQNYVPLIFSITVRPAAGFTPYDMAGTGAGLFIIRFHTWGCMKIIVREYGP